VIEVDGLRASSVDSAHMSVEVTFVDALAKAGLRKGEEILNAQCLCSDAAQHERAGTALVGKKALEFGIG